MKNIFTKIITVFSIIVIIVLALKVGDNVLAKADASTSNVADQCGVNNGLVWNGSTCVTYCDINHPWDAYQRKCSNGYAYNYNYNSTYTNTNCATTYGSNFYFDGKNCVQIVAGQNANYYSNPYNGATVRPVYTNTNTNINTVYNIPNNNIVTYIPDYNYNNSYNNYYDNYEYTNGCRHSCYKESSAKTTEYYIFTITTTTYQTQGTPIYLGNNYNNYNNCFDYCDYRNNNNYGYNEYYDYYSYDNVGYYDIYGRYHY